MAVSLLSAAATDLDAMPTTVATSAATPTWRADGDKSANTTIAVTTTMIPFRTVT
jgi:hypothetical protein